MSNQRCNIPNCVCQDTMHPVDRKMLEPQKGLEEALLAVIQKRQRIVEEFGPDFEGETGDS